ncbi:MAG: peptide ABC transporter substrate-binding protein [Chloroflexi bacterium]|nr:peptide ABC transporter substrate-binding protein [Chloroflexota bacterium]
MCKRTFRFLPALALLIALVVATIPSGFAAASDTEVTIVALYRQATPVTLDTATTTEISSLDPQLGTDVVSIEVYENLFLGLTDLDAFTNQVVPELATSWAVSDDGLTWTFSLRNDVNWMHYDPASDTAEVVRPVVAGDFVYAIKRACDPRIASYYGSIAATVIAGCDIINQTSSDAMTDDQVYGDTTKVSAPDDSTVVIELQFAAGYFFSMTPMWMIRPLPQEVIEQYGDDWTDPGNIVTNGPYFVREVITGVQRTFVRNDALPTDLTDGGNIDLVRATFIEDEGTTYALYLAGQLDSAGIPDAELESVLNDSDRSKQVRQFFDLATNFFAFDYGKAPFDDVHARRAFSASIDRAKMVEEVAGGQGVPMIHFTPPSMFGAPAINEVGVGFNVEYAQAQLAEAGYPNCEGFPNIRILSTARRAAAVEFLEASVEENLGCDPGIFSAEQVEFSVQQELTSPETPSQDRPNMWFSNWYADYLDSHNFVGDVLSCNVANRFMRPCGPVDDLIAEAAAETDGGVRTQLYAEIEDLFFGEEGEFPFIPLYTPGSYVMFQPWYTGPFDTDGISGGSHWDARTIDMAAKLAAQAS